MLVAKSGLTLCNPMDCSLLGSMEFPRQEYWSRLLFPSPGDLPDPGTESRSPALQADSLPSELPGKSLTESSETHSQVTHIANIGPEIREPRSDPNAKIYLQTIFSFSKVSVVLPRCT